MSGKNMIIVNDVNIKKIVFLEMQRLGRSADLNHIDVSQVKNMDKLFMFTGFNGDISKWNVSNVDSMHNIFAASDFQGDISDWKFKENLMIGLDLARVIQISNDKKTGKENCELKSGLLLNRQNDKSKSL